MMTPKQTPVALVFVLWLVGVLAAGQFAKISATLPLLRDVFDVQGASLGFLLSLISAVGLLCGLFAGALVARVGPKALLIGALCLGAGLSAFQSTLPNFGLFLASRALEGVSHLLIVVAAPTVLGQITEARHRAATMTLWSTFFAVSYAVFLWGGVPLVAHFGLAALFLCHASAMVLLAVFVWRMLPYDAIPRSTQTLTARVVVARHITAYTSPHIAAPAAGWLFYATGFVALVTVLPEFFTGPWRHALSGFLPLVTMMVSMTFGIILVRRYTPVPVVITGFLLAFSFAASLAFGVPVAGAGLCVLGAAGLVQAGSFSAIPQLNAQPQDQALANGAMAQLGNAGNMVGTPILLVLTQAYGLPGLIGFALVAFGGGACVHIWLAQLRSKEL